MAQGRLSTRGKLGASPSFLESGSIMAVSCCAGRASPVTMVDHGGWSVEEVSGRLPPWLLALVLVQCTATGRRLSCCSGLASDSAMEISARAQQCRGVKAASSGGRRRGLGCRVERVLTGFSQKTPGGPVCPQHAPAALSHGHLEGSLLG